MGLVVVPAVFIASAGDLIFILVHEVEDVTAIIGVQEQPVPVAEPVGQLAVHVKEVVVGRDFRRPEDAVEKKGVHSSGADGICRPAFGDRPFKMELVAEYSDTDRPVSLLKVSVVCPYIYDAGSPSSVTGRKRAFVKRHFLHGLRLEDREQAQHMLGVVERDSVKEQQILIRPASTHVYSRKSFRAALHARHQLDRLQDIGLAEEHRGVLDHIHRNLDRAHLRGHDSGFPLCRDNSFLDFGVRFQGNVDCGVSEQVERDGGVVITYV